MLFMMLYTVKGVRNVRMGLIWDDKCGAVTIYYSVYTTFYWGELQNMTETQSMWAYLPFNPRAKCGSSRLRSSFICLVAIFGGIMGL
jgi:hypothetical protein